MSQFRDLTMADMAHALSIAANREAAADMYGEIQRLAKETCGWRLFTVLRYIEAEGAVERIHSSDPAAYPVGGRKPLDRLQETHAAMADGNVHLAATREAVRKAYFDHELIFSLGITAILNAPIRHGGRRLGTLNLCGEEGLYGSAAIGTAQVLAGLLSPVLMRR